MMSLMSRYEALGWMDGIEDCRLWAINFQLGIKQPLCSTLLGLCDRTYHNGTRHEISLAVPQVNPSTFFIKAQIRAT